MKQILTMLFAMQLIASLCIAQHSKSGLKFFRFGDSPKEKPGVVMPDGKRLDVSTFGEDYTPNFFSTDGISRLEKWLVKNASKCSLIPTSARIAPCVANPSKIVAIGLNYLKHVQESGSPIPKEPVIFQKAISSLCGPFDFLIIPKNSVKTDWEVELAIIIGKKASYVPEERAMEYIAGFTVINDYSERSFQLEGTGQWTKGKSADTFAPLGPYIVTSRDVGNPQNLKLWLTVNGDTLQRSNTNDMIFKIPFLVSYLSQYMTLMPGDVIATGTPSGVGLGLKPPRYLKPGDVVELGIENIGIQKQLAVAYSEKNSDPSHK